jgi:FlaA1/EpsC-like NDP-sugar epimerase
MDTRMEKQTADTRKKRRRLEHWQLITLYLITYDVIAVLLSYFLALWIRFEARFSLLFVSGNEAYFRIYLIFIPIYAVICILVFWGLRMYRSIWKYKYNLSNSEITGFI